MLKPFRGREVFGAMAFLSQTTRRFSDVMRQMDFNAEPLVFTMHQQEVEELPHALGNIGAAGEEYGIPGIRSASEEAFACFHKNIGKEMDRSGLAQLYGLLEAVRATFLNVIKDTLLLSVSGESVRYFNGDRLGFGEAVEDAFPSSTFDAREASRCRALERWTACVMHCMRALEPALLAMAENVLGSPPKKENWHEVLKEIEQKIEAEKKAGKHAALQFESSAATHFRDIKDGWRNHTMHAKMSFGEEDAVAAYDATRSLMRHLSKQLSE